MPLSVLPARRATIALAALHSIVLGSTAQDPGPVDAVLQSFLRDDPHTFCSRLEARRPAAVPQEIKRRLVDGLPPEGRITRLSQSERAKLSSLQPVLRLHQRDAVYDVMVIAIPQASAGLYERAVVLISQTALALLDASELQAVVAHEISHEYVWDQFQEAKKLKDSRRLQELELYCDGVAILTLLRMGADPTRLTTAIEKIGRVNRQKLGSARNEGNYPSLADRRRFAKAIIEWASGPAKP